jgi:hypothetical protein
MMASVSGNPSPAPKPFSRQIRNNNKMKLKTYLTIFGLSLSYLGFGQGFKPEKLIGKWVSKQEKDIQIWTFKDAAHLHIYNNIHDPSKADTLNDLYRLEKITSTSFELILNSDGDKDKTHEGKDKCIWLNDNQFKIESPLPELIFVFTRAK